LKRFLFAQIGNWK